MFGKILGHLVLYLDNLLFSVLLVLVLCCTAAIVTSSNTTVQAGSAQDSTDLVVKYIFVPLGTFCTLPLGPGNCKVNMRIVA